MGCAGTRLSMRRARCAACCRGCSGLMCGTHVGARSALRPGHRACEADAARSSSPEWQSLQGVAVTICHQHQQRAAMASALDTSSRHGHQNEAASAAARHQRRDPRPRARRRTNRRSCSPAVRSRTYRCDRLHGACGPSHGPGPRHAERDEAARTLAEHGRRGESQPKMALVV